MLRPQETLTARGWFLFAVSFALAALPIALSSTVGPRALSLTLEPEVSWSVATPREAVDSFTFPQDHACYVGVASGRLVSSKLYEIKPGKPFIESQLSDRDELERATKELETSGTSDQHLAVRGRCFELTSTGRLVDRAVGVELVDFGFMSRSNGGLGVFVLLALSILCGAVPAALTTRRTWAYSFFGATLAAGAQVLLWLSQLDFGAGGVLGRTLMVGSVGVPAGVFLGLAASVFVVAATTTNGLVTAVRFALLDARSCPRCQATFSPAACTTCPACSADIPVARWQPAVAFGGGLATALVFVGYVLALGGSLGFYRRCDSKDPGGMCSFFLRQNPDAIVTQGATSNVIFLPNLYLIMTAIVFVPIPLLIARYLHRSRGSALLGAVIAWLASSLAGVVLLSPSLGWMNVGGLLVFHLKALVPWIAPGLAGAFIGASLRARDPAAMQADLIGP
ncbi:MAG: hypothetical protein IPM79_30730 [Polyangiaceae bacterium]|nr:hypothetical protein [Polyangiaceae bacterium]MBK8941861.1 hypothetical protein [Polyangiaceae bacterium]